MSFHEGLTQLFTTFSSSARRWRSQAEVMYWTNVRKFKREPRLWCCESRECKRQSLRNIRFIITRASLVRAAFARASALLMLLLSWFAGTWMQECNENNACCGAVVARLLRVAWACRKLQRRIPHFKSLSHLTQTWIITMQKYLHLHNITALTRHNRALEMCKNTRNLYILRWCIVIRVILYWTCDFDILETNPCICVFWSTLVLFMQCT